MINKIKLFFIFGVLFSTILKTQAQAPTFNWARTIGASASTASGRSITSDAAGNVYTIGDFSGTMDFDPGAGTFNLTSAVGTIFILKLTAAGNFVWAKALGGANSFSYGVQLDNSGNIYATGSFGLTSDFDPGAGTVNLTSAGSTDIFILKLDNNGNFIWAKAIGNTGIDSGRAIDVSGSGNVYTTGTFEATVDFDPGTSTSNLTATSGTDIFVSKLDASGNFVWAKRMGGINFEGGESIALDASESVYTTGFFESTVDFDPGASTFILSTSGGDDIFISKLDVNGNFVWAKKVGSSGQDISESIKIDGAGNSYITGAYDGTVDFDPGTGTFNLTGSTGFFNAFVLKLDINGNFSWAKSISGASNPYGTGIAVDAGGNAFSIGEFSAITDFDPSAGTFNLTPTASNDGYILKLDPAGNFVWAQAIGGAGSQAPRSINVNSLGGLYTTGFIAGITDFDPGAPVFNLTNLGVNDIFIQKMSEALLPSIITNFTPTSGPIGTTVTITGTNFSTTPANNIVYFGATRATVTVATATQLTVTVPVGATYQPIAVNVAGLIAYSAIPFTVTFLGGGTINACSFAAKADFTTGSGPISVSIGDLDGDGKADLAVANGTAGTNTVSVFRNTGSGPGNVSYAAKVDFTTGSQPWSVSVGDLDGDGKADLVVANSAGNVVSVFRNTSTGAGIISYAAKVDLPTGIRPQSVSIGDLDGDGKADLALANLNSNTVSVFRNTGSTGSISFAAKVDFATGTAPRSVSIGDLDGDGKADLAVANASSNTVSVFRNTSSGAGSISYAAKVDFATGTAPRSVSIGDLDGDGKADLAVTNQSSNTVSVFRNTGSAGSINLSSFAAKVDFTTGTSPISVSIGDLDGDGKADLAVANFDSDNVSIFRNTSSVGIISYAPKVDFTTGGRPYSVSIGDLDGDGKADLAIVNIISGTLSIFRNTIGNAPTITSFTPLSGPTGTSVTITGTNFDLTPANNIVKFNGTTAIVTVSTATSITTTVPTGATTGTIEVTVGCNTVTSSTNFTTCNPPPPPGTISNSRCGNGTVTITASGTVNGNYRWYDVATGGTAISGEVNSSFTTPVLTATTTYYVSILIGSCESARVAVAATITTLPASPSITGASSCGVASLTLSASGGTSGQYRWYTVATGGTAITGEVNSMYVTPSLSATTSYFVSINNGTCESNRTSVIATINPVPTAPITTGASGCSPSTIILNASGGTSGQYRWYTVATGGTALTGQTNSSYTTPSLTTTTTYYVSINNGTCESARILVIATITGLCAQPPVINTAPLSTTVGGIVTIDLKPLITTSGTLDVNSIILNVPPSSGAIATITNGVLTISYQGIAFTGKEIFSIRACDTNGNCSTQQFEIEVAGDVMVYNALSPNEDGLNDIFKIEYIDLIPETQNNKVSIYNRWGSKVFEIANYNNTTNVFKGLTNDGNELSSGTYYYKIEFASGRKTETGYLALKK